MMDGTGSLSLMDIQRRKITLGLLLVYGVILQCYQLHKRRVFSYLSWKRMRAYRRIHRLKYGYEDAMLRFRIPYKRKKLWSIASERWDDAECLHFLRFTRAEIQQILSVLQINNRYKWRYRYRATAEEAFCLFCYRLSHPQRLKDCMRVFGKCDGWISTIFNDMALLLVKRYSRGLAWDTQRLDYQQLKEYANAIEREGGVGNIWGFIDGYVLFWLVLFTVILYMN